MKHCKPDITVYRVIAAVTKLERAWNLALVLQIVQKNSQKYFPCLYLSIDQVWLMSRGLKDIFKNAPWRHTFGKSWDG